MASYKEIVTKAVVGKGKKYFKNNYEEEAKDATNVLGCWVINHKFKGYKTGEKIGVDGSFDVNIWYSYENDSKISADVGVGVFFILRRILLVKCVTASRNRLSLYCLKLK